MKLTIPSIQNIKRRETFLFEYTDYYSPKRFEYELLRIAKIRAEKKLRWEQPLFHMKQEERMKETAKTFEIVPKKQGFFKKAMNVFKAQRGS